MDRLTQALGYEPRTIALFRAIKLGDLMVAVPAFRALRRAFPKAHIALIGLPWASDFVARFSAYLDEFIPFAGWPGLPEQPVDASRTVAFLDQMQQRQFDVVIQMQGNGTLVNPMMELLGAKITAGYYPETLPQYRLNPDRYCPYPRAEHEIRRHLSLLEFLGIPTHGTDLEFPVSASDQQRADHLLAEPMAGGKGYVCIHPGGISARRWSESRFAQTADGLAHEGYAVVLTGTASEAGIIEQVRAEMQAPAISLAGKTDLGVIGGVLSRAALLVSNDTGVSHLAAALKVPSVIIYTTSRPEEWGPLNRQLHRAVPEGADAEQVMAEARQLVSP